MSKNEAFTTSFEAALKQQGFLYRPIEGDSMMPLLDQNTDLVKLVPCSQRLKAHDLPLYRRPDGQLVLHRIVKVRRKHYIIRGDNRIPYERVPHDWVVALAVGRVRNGDYFSFDDQGMDTYLKTVCYPKDTFTFRLGVLWARAFPSAKEMKQKFPILKSTPWLLPVCYVLRILGTPLRRLRAKKQRRENSV